MNFKNELRQMMANSKEVNDLVEELKDNCRKAASANQSSFRTSISIKAKPFSVVTGACDTLKREGLSVRWEYVEYERDSDYITVRLIIEW